MNWSQDFIQATVIMVLGMGVTFAFLATLIFAMRTTAKIIARLVPAPEPLPASRTAAPVAFDRNEGEVVAAITIAVKKHHADKKSSTLLRRPNGSRKN